ncbi:DUF2993 domain-containing protein [Streptomyces sp. NPDC051776]|uniref:LmeA family phospholipid-binding protein n=1 Tax=Streptomyces sp. NPDC051776 TaxID=3155414 RepID=UPI00341D4ABA
MRALRILVIVAVVLGGLFVAADRIAVGLAEDEAAEKIKNTQGLSGDPEVSIKGFPFLTQVMSQNLDEVEVKLDGATASAAGQEIRVSRMSAELHDLKIDSDFASATAKRATGSAHISYADLSKASSEGVTVGYGGRDQAGKSQVKVTARLQLPVLGQTFQRSVVSTVSIVRGDTIRLRAESVPGSAVPGLEKVVRERIDFERKLVGLPEGIELDKVVATPDGVDIGVTGSRVRLAG